MDRPLIVGAGAPLMDLLIEADDAFLQTLGAEKGGMTLVGLDVIEKAIDAGDLSVSLVPGGSTCNTMVGIGRLGGRARLFGRLGADGFGEKFKEALARAGVEACVAHSSTPTGRVLSVVTPDAQRTMFTFLGAASEFEPGDVEAEHLSDAEVMLVEGYQLYNQPVVDRLIELTKAHDVQLALDLASFQVVDHCRAYLEDILPSSVHVLIANEDEARAFTGLNEEDSLEAFARISDIAVVKLGERGVLVASGDERFKVDAHTVEAVDTTGAGDLWAAGFLYGVTHGLGLENAMRLGCKIGAEVVQVMGAVIPEEGWDRIHSHKKELSGE